MADVKISALTALTAPALTDLLAIVDVSDTTQGASGSTKKLALSDLSMFLRSEVHVLYMTTAVSGVASDGWYYPDETAVTFTGRIAPLVWEGTSAQIPASGTGVTDFRVGDTALVRGSTL